MTDDLHVEGQPHDATKRFFTAMIRHRRLSLVLVLLFTVACGTLAALKVRPDFSVEMMFPAHDYSKVDYDRFKVDFPYEDAHPIVVVEADDIFTPEGLKRIAALERDLAYVKGVIDVESVLSVKDAREVRTEDGEVGIATEPLIPSHDLSQEEIDRYAKKASQGPVFRWNLAPPDGSATIIRVTLDAEYAAKDSTRMQYLLDARKVLEKHDRPGQRIVMSGMPVLRAEYTEMILRDMMRLIPIATVLMLIILYLSFRSVGLTVAAGLTLAASNVWTLGGFGVLGYPLQLMSQITPIVVMIVSISDTVHIVRHYKQAVARGMAVDHAVIEATVDSCWPCFLTELVIALGFLALIGQDIIMISQFGLVTAIGMILTWAANMTVLPLALTWVRPPATQAEAKEAESAVTRGLSRLLGWIDGVTIRRPGRVVAIAAVITLGAGALGHSIGKEYRAYDDLKPESTLAQNIAFLEAKHGGSVPFAVLLEPAPRRVLLVGVDAAARQRVMRALEPAKVDLDVREAPGPEEGARLGRGGEPGWGRPDLIVVGKGVDPGFLGDLGRPADAAGTAAVLLRPGLDEKGRRQTMDRLFGEGVYSVVGIYDLTRDEDRRHLAGSVRLGEGMLDPKAIATMDRIARFLETRYPEEMKQASTVSEHLAKVHELWVGPERFAEEPLPTTRGAVMQELEFVDRPPLRDFLAPDRAKAAVYGQMKDCGSSRTTEILADLRSYLREEEEATGYKITATGLFVVADGTYRNLVGGLTVSLGGAILVSLLTFIIVLRSWRLGLIALLPNVLPLLLTFGMMAALGIDLKPTTVICFTITLVIADDDTIQFLVRFRRRLLQRQAAGEEDAHSATASETLDDTGVPMFLTACTVSLGFFTLLFSEFEALQNLGLLIGVSLFTAVFADLFLSPVMLRTFRPKIGSRP